MTGCEHTAAASANTIGVDVGGTNVRVGLVGPDETLLFCSTSPSARGAEALTGQLAAAIQRAVAASGERVDAVAIGMPGHIDSAAGTVANAVNLGIDRPVAIGPRLSSALGVRVTLASDVDVAAMAAHRHLGTGRDLAYVSVGTGLSAAFVLGGVVRTGTVGAGEIGHTPAPGGTRRCPCGQVGCAETMASGGAMLHAWQPDDRGGLDDGSRVVPAQGRLFALWDAADSGRDHAATVIRHECVETLAWIIQAIVVTLDVDDVLIGGGVSRLGDRLLEPIRSTLDERSAASTFLSNYRLSERVSVAPADAEFGVIGAALLARGCSP